MDALSIISPMAWLIFAAAAIICVLALFAKAITFSLKLAIIAVMLLFVAYFLVEAGIIQLPQ